MYMPYRLSYINRQFVNTINKLSINSMVEHGTIAIQMP